VALAAKAATKKSSFCCPERVHAERAGTGCARAMGMQIQIMNAGTRREIDAAFETIAREQHDALLVGSDTFFRGRGAASLALHQKNRARSNAERALSPHCG